MSFDEFSSHSHAASTLKAYLTGGHLPHALLFSGPAGSRQRQSATELAKVIFCENPLSAQDPCGSCVHCRWIDQSSHPDFTVLEPEEDSRVIKVETIRELIAKANFKPLRARAKFFVINRAECMNEIAQNALLKTLEEPPQATYIVLISYADESILRTVRSRTQQIHFLPLVSEAAADPQIEALRFEVLSFIAREGSWKTAETSLLERAQVLTLLDRLCSDLRDMLILGAGAGEILGFTNDKPLKERALNTLSEDRIFQILHILSEFKEKISESVNLKLALSVLRDELSSAAGRAA